MVHLEDARGVRRNNDVKLPDQISAEAKRFMIINDVAEGMSYSNMVKKYMDKWGLAQSTVQQNINEALRYMRSDEFKESITSINMERLDNLIVDSIKDGDRKNAIKAIDTQNKAAGAYTEKIKIEGDSEINLIFDAE